MSPGARELMLLAERGSGSEFISQVLEAYGYDPCTGERIPPYAVKTRARAVMQGTAEDRAAVEELILEDLEKGEGWQHNACILSAKSNDRRLSAWNRQRELLYKEDLLAVYAAISGVFEELDNMAKDTQKQVTSDPDVYKWCMKFVDKRIQDREGRKSGAEALRIERAQQEAERKEKAEKEKAAREATIDAARIMRVKQQEVDSAYRRCDNLPYQPGINKVCQQCLADADAYARSVGLPPRR
jgi:hypothetical protein